MTRSPDARYTTPTSYGRRPGSSYAPYDPTFGCRQRGAGLPSSEITASKPRSPSFSPVLRGSWPRSRCTLICSGSSPSTPEASPGFHPKKAGSRGDRPGSRYGSEWDALGASSTSVVDRSMPRSPPSTGFVPAFWPPRGALVIRRSTATSESPRPMISCRSPSRARAPRVLPSLRLRSPLVATTGHGGCRAVLLGDPLVSTTPNAKICASFSKTVLSEMRGR
jgi:hypothetical protein